LVLEAQARNRTRAWLAAQIGVHVNTISRWERDGISPEHRALPRIAIALDGLAELLVALRLRSRALRRVRSPLEALDEARVHPHERIARPVADLIVAGLHWRAFAIQVLAICGRASRFGRKWR
jgi:transcriptional regulator with XRE-family HTH domain